MMNFFKNNFYRVSSKKYNLVISLFMTMLSISLAIYFNPNQGASISIAVVTQNRVSTFQSEHVQFVSMEKEPPKYQLVLGKYDGVLIDRGNGEYEVETIKNDTFRKMLEEIVKSPKNFTLPVKAARGIGTNIIGYLLMFILLQCVLFMFTLSEDMELKQIERIATAPVSFGKYLLSHFLCNYTLVFVPAFFVLTVMKGIFGFDIGFSLLQYAALLGLLCFFGTAFTMFISCLVKRSDTANMMGSAIVLLTTILSGSFYSFEKGNEILEKGLRILPQKAFLNIVQGLENGKTVSAMLLQFSYVMMISLFFFTFSVIKIKKDYVRRKD